MESPPREREWMAALAAMAGGAGALTLWRLAWVAAAWRWSGLRPDLASFAERREALQHWVSVAPWAHAGVFFCLYALVCAMCLPGTLTLVAVAGALFGWWRGALIALPAALLGCTGAFLLSRHLAGPWVRRAFPKVVEQVDRGLLRGGDWFVLTARMLPVSSFSLVNLGLGVTGVSPGRFVALSALGLLPGTLAYAWAGQNLGNLRGVGDLLSPELWLALLALALVPPLIGWVLKICRKA